MSLHILKSGLLDTIQDRGRFGYAHLGINANGAMDKLAMAVANALVGNQVSEAVLELHFPAAEIQLKTPALLSLAGADFSAQANGKVVPANSAVFLPEGAVLKFRQLLHGARCYLAVAGGFDLEPWLDSCSTNLAAGVGGWQGRALQAAGKLPFRKSRTGTDVYAEKHAFSSPCRANTSSLFSGETAIRFCAGPEYNWLEEGSKQQLLQNKFQVTAQSDRMGYRLNGPRLLQKDAQELISAAVLPGAIQLLPNGQTIVLMADCQTTGGYPRIGQVIQADLPKLAQMRAGEIFTFQEVPLTLAFAALQAQTQMLRRLLVGCKLLLEHHRVYFTT
jgi:biotin-dependent carboxylase-like uncharacterized protein